MTEHFNKYFKSKTMEATECDFVRDFKGTLDL